MSDKERVKVARSPLAILTARLVVDTQDDSSESSHVSTAMVLADLELEIEFRTQLVYGDPSSAHELSFAAGYATIAIEVESGTISAAQGKPLAAKYTTTSASIASFAAPVLGLNGTRAQTLEFDFLMDTQLIQREKGRTTIRLSPQAGTHAVDYMKGTIAVPIRLRWPLSSDQVVRIQFQPRIACLLVNNKLAAPRTAAVARMVVGAQGMERLFASGELQFELATASLILPKNLCQEDEDVDEE